MPIFFMTDGQFIFIIIFDLSMDNKLLGIIIIGFGLLVLFSKQEYSWVISAIAVGIGSGFLIRKSEKNDLEN